MTAPTAPPGWYPNPNGGHGYMYWDGTTWHSAIPATGKPPQKHRGWMIAGGAVIALIVLGAIGDSDSEDSTSPSETTTSLRATAAPPTVQPTVPTTVQPAALPGVGEEVRDGKFGFVVTSVDRSKIAGDTSNPYMQTTAQGEFVNIHLTVTNTGDRAQTFFASNQTLEAGGKQFDADSTAAMWSDAAIVEINPGNSIDTVVSFDVPVGTPAGVLEVHDSMFSFGADIQLAQAQQPGW